MNRGERVQCIQSMEAYARKHELREYFLRLISDLCVARPDSPLDYLIQKLTDKRTQRLFFLNFFETEIAEEVASYICNSFNFKLIKASGISLDSKKASQKIDFLSIEPQRTAEFVLAALKKVEPLYKGVVVVGFPNDPGQADFIFKKGFLPERTFLVKINASSMQRYYKRLHPHAPISEIKAKVTRNMVWEQQLIQFLGPNATVLPLEPKEQLQAGLKSIISIRDRKSVPITALRVLVLHPPYVGKLQCGLGVSDWLSHKFGLVEVSLQSSVKGQVQDWVRSRGKFTDQIEHSIVYTRCTSTESKMKGFVLDGWPASLSHRHFFKDSKTSPHLIVILEDDHDYLLACFKRINPADPVFNIKGKPTETEYEKMLHEWVLLKDWVSKEEAGKTQTFRLSTEPEQSLTRVLQLQLQNPKIYS